MSSAQSLSAGSPRPRRLDGVRAMIRGLRGQDANALAEMAVIVCFFAPPFLLGTAEIAQVAYGAAEIQDAANAGAAYGMVSSTLAASTSAITTAAQADAPDFGTNLSVTPTNYWVCASNVTGTQYATQASATSACTGSNNAALEFLKVATSATVTPTIRYAKLGSSYTLHGLSVQEVEQ